MGKEQYFTFSKEQLKSLKSLQVDGLDTPSERSQFHDLTARLTRLLAVLGLFKSVFGLFISWVMSYGCEEDLVLAPVSGKELGLHVSKDPNASFLQPKGSRRYVLLPLQYPLLFSYYEGLRDLPWTPKSADVDLGKDKQDFRELIQKEPGLKQLIWGILGYFSCADGIILENVQSNFEEEVAIPECRAWYAAQAANESVHAHMYSLLIECYVESPADREELFNSIENMPAVKAKAKWAQFWLSKKHSFAERLVAFTAVEGIHFASSFSIIWWIKSRFGGKMPGLIKSNEWISRDENMHVEFAMAFYSFLLFPIPLERIREIYMSALKAELIFVKAIMASEGISGLSIESLEEHVRYMANFWFALFQDPKHVQILVLNPDGTVPQPRPEFRSISKYSKVNFFEVKNANYPQPDVTNQGVNLGGKW